MGQTLTHGIYLPDEGERNCYNGLASNWSILDGAVGTIAEHTTALAGKAPLVHTHTKSDITDFPVYGNTAGTICEGNDSRLSDARTPVSHTHTKSDVTDLLNSNFTPSANKSYDLGSSSYQWNNLYAKNYYYNGVAWGLDKNNWWSLAQFYAQNSIHVRNVEPGVAPSSDVSAGIKFENANASYAFADIVGKVFSSGTTFVTLIASNKFTNGALDPNGTTVSKNLQIGIRGNGTGFIYTDCGWRCNLVPPSAESGVYSLGTSTNKWKTLNGINPGALSLPDYTLTKVDLIDFSQWSVAGLRNNYTPDSDGWLFVNIKDTASNSIFIYAHGLYNADPTKSTDYSASGFGNGSQGLNGRIAVMLPVRAGIVYGIYIKAASVSEIYSAKFYPALGNV